MEHTGKYRVRNRNTGLYLVAPVDGWGKTTPEWERIPEAAFRFNAEQAQDQVNFLWWEHRLRAYSTKALTMNTK